MNILEDIFTVMPSMSEKIESFIVREQMLALKAIKSLFRVDVHN